MIDASSSQDTLKLVAENLYDILVSKRLSTVCRLLVCRTKTDLPNAITESALEKTLNAEIETLRKSRSHELEGECAIDNYLGVEDEIFDIRNHSPIEVSFGSISVKEEQTQVVEEFIRST